MGLIHLGMTVLVIRDIYKLVTEKHCVLPQHDDIYQIALKPSTVEPSSTANFATCSQLTIEFQADQITTLRSTADRLFSWHLCII